VSTNLTAISPVAPAAGRIRAYFAPVNRATNTPSIFDPAQNRSFNLDAPPAPWTDLGWISKFARKCGTKVDPLRAGSPAVTVGQVRTEIEATVAFEFETWGRLQATLASGSQGTNLLATASGATPNGSGGTAAGAVALLSSPASTATTLNIGTTAAAGFSAGNLVAVDIDYTGQTGYIGSGVSTAYVQSAAAVGSDMNYIRRVTLNVGLIVGIDSGILTLAAPLPAGAPAAGMKVSQLAGFCDREGASFFQEWSALFVIEGEQGDRILYHYPRLQAMQGSTEIVAALAAPLESVRLAGAFRALPVKDLNDGETVVCFRSYLPAPLRLA
jgi:hypothetical protein